MPVLVCPRCKRTNPGGAVFCYHDGMVLQAGANGAVGLAGQMPREFYFPSGRCCKTYDQFAQGCREEWLAARDLLRQGVFLQFFGGAGRGDLAKSAQEAMEQGDIDIGLTTFLGALPVTQTEQPRLDTEPRRFDLGHLLVGEVRQFGIAILNKGKGTLQGTLKISEASPWLKLPDGTPSCQLSTASRQLVSLNLDTRGLAAGQTYGAALTLITNGGVDEIPVRFDLAAQPFGVAPFQGVRSPREMAERMRKQPKAAGPILESGALAKWFADNGWPFPVQGPLAKGVAAVQQFFEAMGLSKPPPVQISQRSLRFRCQRDESIRFQVNLTTPAKKWIYAHVTSDKPWMRVLGSMVSGPQRAVINVEVDGRQVRHQGDTEGNVVAVANAGQTLSVHVQVEVNGLPAAPPPQTAAAVSRTAAPSNEGVRGDIPVAQFAPPASAGSSANARTEAITATRGRPASAGSAHAGSVPRTVMPGVLRSALVLGLLFLVVRLALVPLVDIPGRGAQLHAAVVRVAQAETVDGARFRNGAWLQFPWPTILAGSQEIAGSVFDPALQQTINTRELRHYYFNYLLRKLMMWTFWLGALLGALVVYRRGGKAGDLAWGLVAGTAAGLVAGATLGAVFLAVDRYAHGLWSMLFAGKGGGGYLLLWIAVALIWWAVAGAIAGALLHFITPLRRQVLDRLQRHLGRLFHLCGLHGMGKVFLPQ